MRALDWPDPGSTRATGPSYSGRRDWTVRSPTRHQQTFSVQTTASGFRGDGPPTTGDWTLAVGCSTTFGWAVIEAWPAQLGEIWGEPVVNGGVPGWTSLQGVRGLERLMSRDNDPAGVILAFGVRDLQRSHRPDSEARATAWVHRTRWATLLRGARPATTGGIRAAGVRRVSEEEVIRNLQRLVDMVTSRGAEPVLLWFPQPTGGPEEDELERMRAALTRPPCSLHLWSGTASLTTTRFISRPRGIARWLSGWQVPSSGDHITE